MIGILIGFGSLCLLLLLLLFSPLSLRVRFTEENELLLTVKVYGIPVFRIPKPEKPFCVRKNTPEALAAQAEREKKKAARKAARKAHKAQKKKTAAAKGKKPAEARGWRGFKAKLQKLTPGMSVTESLSYLADLAADLLGRTFARTTVTVRRLNIRVATGDAAQTALLYGGVLAATNHLLAILQGFTRLRLPNPKHIGVYADYVSGKTRADADILFCLHLYQILGILLHTFFRFISTRQAKKKNLRSLAK